ncbi:unnamed protein product [Chrysodeixis includens]|uniref:Nose resistant-to-fluoxetine protein N-terminal domain-containing protein n=1 Tax=Chrysodeixis includens TaxID=689277 RepID=A0A9P0BLT3_CHRIL|nr:unnamed protein product [Chrysodeixis includens]
MGYKAGLVLFLVSLINYDVCAKELRNTAIDKTLLEEVIDAEECDRQINVIKSNSMLLFQFLDAGARVPKGILTGNMVDLGNYHQCLGINLQLEQMHIQGKYCSILVPFSQNIALPLPSSLPFDPSALRIDEETAVQIDEFNMRRKKMRVLSGDFDDFEDDLRSTHPLAHAVFRLGVCVPKPCTTEQAMTSLIFNATEIGFRYTESYCRLLGDKPFVPANVVAITIFACLGFLTLVSTSYDVFYRFVFKKDVKQQSVLCRSFSVYTNGKILSTFSSNPGNLKCLDGIRTLAMVWVVIGHCFQTEPFIANPIDSNVWMISGKALWITIAPMTVDTFFTLGGILLVYTTAAKMKQGTFLRSLHWFYLNRFMRVTPLLAVAVLLQATYYNTVVDGPHWVQVSEWTDRCRNNWWSTIFHVQNIVNPRSMCVPHSWYVAIDFQVYVLSPIILYWVFSGKKHLAWTALLAGLLSVIVASTIFVFHIEVAAGTLVPSRFEEMWDYLALYYFNTLTRASPFFVGLLFGYVLHLYRKEKMQLPWFIAIFFWLCAVGVVAGIVYFTYCIKQFEWDNQVWDNIMNSFMRPAYAVALSWMIIACVHGYAGPINWLLSLDMWRMPARLTYGIYVFHFGLMTSLNAAMLTPFYFSVPRVVFKFLAHMTLAILVSYFFTLLVDTPVSVLFKLLMDAAAKKNKPATKDNNPELNKENAKIEDVKRDLNKVDANHVNDIDNESVPVSSGVQEEPNVVRIADTGVHTDDSVPETK